MQTEIGSMACIKLLTFYVCPHRIYRIVVSFIYIYIYIFYKFIFINLYTFQYTDNKIPFIMKYNSSRKENL